MTGLLQKIAAAVALFAAGVTIGYIKGENAGKVEQLKASVQAFENRKDIDNATQNLDRYSLCLAAGGMPANCDELRRMDEAAKDQ